MIPTTYDYLMWQMWNSTHWLTPDVDNYLRRSEKKKEEITEAINKTGIVQNTHKPYHPKLNPRRPVDEHQAKVIAWAITAKSGNYAGERPKRT